MRLSAMLVVVAAAVLYTSVPVKGEDTEMMTSTTDDQMAADQEVIKSLVQNRAKINRDVTVVAEGVETYTRSTDPIVAGWIKTHVAAMKSRVENKKPIREGDPLFAAVFENAADIKFEYSATEDGVKVVETSTKTCAKDLIKAHAAVVTAFIEKGPEETKLKHTVPSSCPFASSTAAPLRAQWLISSAAAAVAFSLCAAATVF